MCDIRKDLRERLSSLEERRAQLQATLKAIEDESAAVMRLLDYEDRRFSPEESHVVQSDCNGLAELIIKEIRGRAMTKGEIRELADGKGYLAESEFPGRTIHSTLLNIQRSDRVRIRHDGRYETIDNVATKAETPNSGTLFGASKTNGAVPLSL